MKHKQSVLKTKTNSFKTAAVTKWKILRNSGRGSMSWSWKKTSFCDLLETNGGANVTFVFNLS